MMKIRKRLGCDVNGRIDRVDVTGVRDRWPARFYSLSDLSYDWINVFVRTMASRLLRMVSFVRLIVSLTTCTAFSAFFSWTLTPRKKVLAFASTCFEFVATPVQIFLLFCHYHTSVNTVEIGGIFVEPVVAKAAGRLSCIR
jgi:hypothetical protein